jgi:hypothetical protein
MATPVEKKWMNRHLFELLPFESDPTAADYHIDGLVERSGERLSIDFSLAGPLDKVLIHPPAEVPARKDRLWEETCFECFIATELNTWYWEINLAPAGHWNIYRFDAYRCAMKEASACSVSLLMGPSTARRFQCRCDLDLNQFGLAHTRIRLGVCAILKTTDAKVLYWALVHPGPTPDFHLQDGFILNL